MWRGNCSWENGTWGRVVVPGLHRASWAGSGSREIPPPPRARLSSGSDILCKLATRCQAELWSEQLSAWAVWESDSSSSHPCADPRLLPCMEPAGTDAWGCRTLAVPEGCCPGMQDAHSARGLIPRDAGCLQCWSAVATGMQDTCSTGWLMPGDAGHIQHRLAGADD